MTDIKNTNQTDVVRSERDDEIDLIQLAKTLWEGRRTVIKTTIIFMAIGLFVAIFSQKEYAVTTSMVPQSAEAGSKFGGLGGLAAMAGINLGSLGNDAGISPTLYPQIIYSIPFKKKLAQTELSIEGCDEKVTYTDYYEEIYSPGLFGYIKKYTIGLPGLLIKAIKGENNNGHEERILPVVSEQENELFKKLDKSLSIDVNDQDGYISLTARMPEAKAAAQLVKHAQDLLQEEIIELKISKAKDQLSFIEERYLDKKKEYERSQELLAAYRDQNKNITTYLRRIELEGLEAEYKLNYQVYSELAKQLEAQRLKVKEDTPIFIILQPVTIPFEKSKPNRPVILILWTFLGGLIGAGKILGKKYLNGIMDPVK